MHFYCEKQNKWVKCNWNMIKVDSSETQRIHTNRRFFQSVRRERRRRRGSSCAFFICSKREFCVHVFLWRVECKQKHTYRKAYIVCSSTVLWFICKIKNSNSSSNSSTSRTSKNNEFKNIYTNGNADVFKSNKQRGKKVVCFYFWECFPFLFRLI